MDPGDEDGCTYVGHLEELRVDFKNWVRRLTLVDPDNVPSSHEGHGLRMCSDVEGGNKLAREFITTFNQEQAWRTDSRLCLMDMYFSWGLKRRQVIGGPSNPHNLDAAERLKYLVDRQPSCLDVDWNADHGRWFWPIDANWLPSINEKHGWTASLAVILRNRLSDMYSSDQDKLVSGACVNPQPPGRYMAPPDFIGMWNKSCGKCPTCPNDIWLGYDPTLEDKPPGACLATVQRLDNSIIHLRQNCADLLVCRRCNGKTRLLSALAPTAPVGGDA